MDSFLCILFIKFIYKYLDVVSMTSCSCNRVMKEIKEFFPMIFSLKELSN